MKTLMMILTAALLLASCSRPSPQQAGQEAHEVAQAADKAGEEYYTCPMHPWVRSAKPGPCPVCGMAMVRRVAHAGDSAEAAEGIRKVSLSPAQRVLANVSTQPVTRRTLDRTLDAVGVVDYAEPSQATVAARFGGRIEKLFVNFTGEVVRRGQPLFELHSPDLLSAEQEYVLALQALERTGSTDPSLRSQQEGLVEAGHEKLMVHFGLTEDQIAAVARSRATHSTAVFSSPVRGTVVAKQIQEGQYVNEGMVLYQLADLSRVWVYIDVYESSIGSVALGQTVAVTAEAYPNETFTGRLTFIEPSVNPETRTVRVRTELDNRGGRLRPQMYVRARLSLPVLNSLVIPATAVLATGKRNVVWVEVASNTFEPRDVTLGARTDGAFQVLGGLAEGEQVAVTGGYLLESESQLQQPVARDGVPTAPSPTPAADSASGSGRQGLHSVRIEVDGKFVPNIVHAKRGEPLRLVFYRQKESGCIQAVVIEQLHIRKNLAPLALTPVDLTPAERGEIVFTCGMGMVRGSVVVD